MTGEDGGQDSRWWLFPEIVIAEERGEMDRSIHSHLTATTYRFIVVLSVISAAD